MRRRIAEIVVLLSVVCVSAKKSHVRAESAACPPRSSSAADDKAPSGPRISVVEVTFSGVLQVPITDRDQIADSIKQQDYGDSLDGLVDDAVERVKAGWRDRGYFKAQVSGKTETLTSSDTSRHIALRFHVDEGLQYSLRQIIFKNNEVIRDVAALRGLFPINDGDIFSREKIAKGLDNLRKIYGEMGYINFFAIPDSKLDDDNRLASLDIDFDEGKPYHMGAVNILGLDEPTRQQLLERFPMKRGQIYDEGLFQSFLVNHASAFPEGGRGYTISRDDKAGTVTASFDFRPCSD